MALQDVFLYSQNWRFLDTKTYLPPNFLGGEKISQLDFLGRNLNLQKILFHC